MHRCWNDIYNVHVTLRPSCAPVETKPFLEVYQKALNLREETLPDLPLIDNPFS